MSPEFPPLDLDLKYQLAGLIIICIAIPTIFALAWQKIDSLNNREEENR